jgi:superfamily II DNA or RNA helicase
MEKIIVQKYDEVHAKVICEAGTAYEIQDYFTFLVPGYQFMPAYRNKMWDGKIRLYNVYTKTLYMGLLEYLVKFANERDYEVEFDGIEQADEFSLFEAKEFAESLKLPFEPRDYQYKAFVHSVRNRRSLLLSPTASGKSLIIYLLIRWFNAKTLVIVPTTSLVHQLVSDFKDYGWTSDEHCHKVMAGVDKVSDKQVIVSTWQSVYKLNKEYFDQFDVVIGDEAHLFKAKSLMTLLEKMKDCKYRYGLTGTLDGTQTHKLVLEGLFGPVKKVTTTKELMDNKQLAEFRIKALALNYSDAERQEVSKMKYQQEMDFLVRHEKRNRFIRNLTISQEGNTLLLFQYVEKHGRVLFDDINNRIREKYFLSTAGQMQRTVKRLERLQNSQKTQSLLHHSELSQQE